MSTDLTGTEEQVRGDYFVQSLERGLAVVRAFTPQRYSMTLSEVARATGLTRAAARRSLLTLVDLGYVRTNGRTFALTPRVLELGYAYLSSAGCGCSRWSGEALVGDPPDRIGGGRVFQRGEQ